MDTPSVQALPNNFEEDAWQRLKHAIAAINNKQPVGYSYEELYRVSTPTTTVLLLFRRVSLRASSLFGAAVATASCAGVVARRAAASNGGGRAAWCVLPGHVSGEST